MKRKYLILIIGLILTIGLVTATTLNIIGDKKDLKDIKDKTIEDKLKEKIIKDKEYKEDITKEEKKDTKVDDLIINTIKEKNQLIITEYQDNLENRSYILITGNIYT